ncbi:MULTISPECIES: MFS transporter [Olivibacter]|uniref:Major facilitator superfamily MFS_1 n=3 Tax=Sphingobacteriaceae TaxID=84566 RepID=F4C1U3_SPHS2|nr:MULTISPECIES: MFS transporter [Olivibacter]MCL4637448.1 MFS transporter [Olivibacter sp. UJ_SKK_5.1]MDM8174686.1 MFS transporter [Olivibacter sp. 47]MDX3913559.1 MFS transporter [Pseudosphingobacterium sp.]
METHILPATAYNRNRVRLAVSLFYFCQGLAFASWASRIPDIKTKLHLSDGQLGSLLFALPLGQLATMALSGTLVTKFGSKKVLTVAAALYVVALTNLGLASQGWHLGVSLFIFGIIGNMCNIAVNTQGVAAENLFDKPIMSSFHGAWSIAGFTGALVGLLMINLHIAPYLHFWIIAGLVWISILINNKFLVAGVGPASTTKKKLFSKPEGALLQLGVIGFCSMATEGAMFDWSGVYFKDIVKAPQALVPLGYASFMVMMASGRFIGDRLIARLGRKRVLQVSGVLISSGMFLAVLFPYIITAVIAFMLVGLGVATVVPTVYSVAGRNAKVSPGIALAMVSSVSYLGFLMGPPLIGYIAELASLRYSYAVIGVFGLVITLLVAKIRAINQ